MTPDELLARIDGIAGDTTRDSWNIDVLYPHSYEPLIKALRAVVELHKPEHSIRGYRCTFDDELFPCKHHIAIAKELG